MDKSMPNHCETCARHMAGWKNSKANVLFQDLISQKVVLI